MDTTTLPGIDPAANAAAAAIAPDAITASILAKHSAGERLTPQECGKLGAWKRKANGDPVGRGNKKVVPGAQPALAGAPSGGSSLAGQSTAEAAGDGLPAAPADPLLVSRTAGVVLARVDSGIQGAIANRVRAIGGTPDLAAEYCKQAALPADTKDILTQLSPMVVESCGGNASNFPMLAFAVAMVGWVIGIGIVFFNLRQLSKDHAKIFAGNPPAPATATAATN